MGRLVQELWKDDSTEITIAPRVLPMLMDLHKEIGKQDSLQPKRTPQMEERFDALERRILALKKIPAGSSRIWAAVAAGRPPTDTSRHVIDNTVTLRPTTGNAEEYQGRTPVQILQRIRGTIQRAVAARPLRSGEIRITIASPKQKAAVLRSADVVADALGERRFVRTSQ